MSADKIQWSCLQAKSAGPAIRFEDSDSPSVIYLLTPETFIIFMNIVEIEQSGEVEAVRLGYGPIGRPFMSVYLYILDGSVIIFKRLDSAKAKWIKLMNRGNVSYANMLRSAYQLDSS